MLCLALGCQFGCFTGALPSWQRVVAGGKVIFQVARVSPVDSREARGGIFSGLSFQADKLLHFVLCPFRMYGGTLVYNTSQQWNPAARLWLDSLSVGSHQWKHIFCKAPACHPSKQPSPKGPWSLKCVHRQWAGVSSRWGLDWRNPTLTARPFY